METAVLLVIGAVALAALIRKAGASKGVRACAQKNRPVAVTGPGH